MQSNVKTYFCECLLQILAKVYEIGKNNFRENSIS